MTASSSGGHHSNGYTMDVGQVSNNQLVDITKVDQSNVKYFVVDGKLRMFEQVGAKAADAIRKENGSMGATDTARKAAKEAKENTTEAATANKNLREFHWEKASDDVVASYNRNQAEGMGMGKVTGQSRNDKVCGNNSNGKTQHQAYQNQATASNNQNLFVKHYDDVRKAA
jgi:hypothetical protein